MRKKRSSPEKDPPSNELRIRHLTVDEALPLLEQFLYDSYMAGMIQVRIIHGKGTGTLRRLVETRLASHPLVSSHRPGEYGEGGAGVTVALLSSR